MSNTFVKTDWVTKESEHLNLGGEVMGVQLFETGSFVGLPLSYVRIGEPSASQVYARIYGIQAEIDNYLTGSGVIETTAVAIEADTGLANVELNYRLSVN